MATTFHLFPFLPWELRARIWELTVEPRTVDVHATTYFPEPNEDPEEVYTRLISFTPVPATLQTCRESRNLGLYQKVLFEVEVVPEGGERRYIWLNFDLDMIDIGWADPHEFDSIAQFVKRLKLRTELFDGHMVASFNAFTNLTEARIFFYRDALRVWYTSFVFFKLSCDPGHIFLSDVKNDRTITAQELRDDYKRQRPGESVTQLPMSALFRQLFIPTLIAAADFLDVLR
ncbi:hypothetical protein QR685DRAFT_570292 [Neurospora intermedia]|uniref:2EXR domain-containing protein n=1 Tax=Neurospora intermedia TaxID=5142 RepID=A0ABR3DGW4_NEUIN